MKTSWLGAAFTYVGAVVGAGFASGQEIYQFFSRFGGFGIVGIILAGILFMTIGFFALERGRIEQTQGFRALFAGTYPPWLTRIAEGVTAAFLFLGLGVVSAGGGAALSRVAGWPIVLGSVVTTLAIAGVARRGTHVVVHANSVLVPYLLLLTIGVSLLTWGRPPVSRVSVAGPGWALSALLYLSYNIFTGIMVLLGIGKGMASKRHSLWAALGGAFLLSGVAVLEHHALVRIPSIQALPLVDLAYQVHYGWGILYVISVWVALFTTGVAQAYALQEQYGAKILYGILITFLLSFWGFQRLVSDLYPVMGVVAVLLWFPLIYRPTGRLPEG